VIVALAPGDDGPLGWDDTVELGTV